MAHIYESQLDSYELYHKKQETAHEDAGVALPALGHAIAGSTGAAISNLALYPLDLIITRLQVQRLLRKSSSTPTEDEYKGIFDAAEKIYSKEGGIKGFYAGIVQDTGKTIADSFLFFLFYNYIRTNRLQKHGANATTLPVFDELGVGMLAGACSKLFTTPIANVVTRKQTASMISAQSGSAHREPSVSEIARDIRAEKGILGFWSGYSASLVLTLNPSLTFFLHESFKRAFLPREKRDDPGARITFLMAAVSKAIASTATYPFSLAKKRAQVSSKSPADKGTVEDAKSSPKTAAKRSTVIDTILRIYREEGLSALYEGVWGEIFRGFFSHGLTMLVKEAVHKFVISTYYTLLKLFNKLPRPSEVVEQAQEKAQEVVGQVQDKAQEVAGQVQDRAQGAYAQAGTIAGQAQEKAGELASQAGEYASQAQSKATEIASQASGAASGAYEKASEAASQAQSKASEVASQAQSKVGEVASQAQSKAGEVTSQVQSKAGAAVSQAQSKAGEVASQAQSKTAALASQAQNKAGELASQAQNKASNLTSQASTAAAGEALKSEEAGHLLGNAQDMLGNKLKKGGE